MNKLRVRLNQVSDIVSFVAIANKCECDVDARCGSIVVDAKSLLGVLGFGMGKVLTLQVYGDDSSMLMSDISEYLVVR